MESFIREEFSLLFDELVSRRLLQIGDWNVNSLSRNLLRVFHLAYTIIGAANDMLPLTLSDDVETEIVTNFNLVTTFLIRSY